MRIDPVDLEWRQQLHVNDPVDALNVFGNWCPALVVHVTYLFIGSISQKS